MVTQIKFKHKLKKANQSWWYPTYRNDLTVQSSQEIALSYAKYTQEQLYDKGLPKNVIVVEQRGGLDTLYTSQTNEGEVLNYRSMVTLYVKKR